MPYRHILKGKEQPEQRIYSVPGAMRKTGVPAKHVLWGDSTAGLSYKRPEGAH